MIDWRIIYQLNSATARPLAQSGMTKTKAREVYDKLTGKEGVNFVKLFRGDQLQIQWHRRPDSDIPF